METDPFKEYPREVEPDKQYRGYVWHTAISLQAVGGLKTSDYLAHITIRNIKGEITFTEVNALLDARYTAKPVGDAPSRVEEANKVSVRTATLLSKKAFSFTPGGYLGIYRRPFSGIYPHVGQMRDYNIIKEEWVLSGATVPYGSATELEATLEYDFSEERQFSYKGLSLDETVAHPAVFVSRLRQIHIFAEDNTRTTVMFFIKYLHTLGLEVTNDTFAENAWYFRNALVRANYSDLKDEVHATTEHLELFLRNLLSGEKHPLRNQTLHVSLGSEIIRKPDIETNKPDTDSRKPDIDEGKPDVAGALPTKAAQQAMGLREVFPDQEAFGHAEVIWILSIKASRGSELLRQLLEHGVIETISGHGKGKYCFRTSA